jgi:hypothetical protein
METIKVTSGLEKLLEAAQFIAIKYIVQDDLVLFEQELDEDECLELELSGAKFEFVY